MVQDFGISTVRQLIQVTPDVLNRIGIGRIKQRRLLAIIDQQRELMQELECDSESQVERTAHKLLCSSWFDGSDLTPVMSYS